MFTVSVSIQDKKIRVKFFSKKTSNYFLKIKNLLFYKDREIVYSIWSHNIGLHILCYIINNFYFLRFLEFISDKLKHISKYSIYKVR